MEEYRPAKRIELHDADVIVTLEDDESGWARGDDNELANIFEIQGEDLSELLRMVGINPNPIYSEDQKGIRHKRFMENYNFPLIRKCRQVSGNGGFGEIRDDYQIIKLLAWPKSERMLEIEFRHELSWEDKEGNHQTELQTEKLTYSGSYTVWWV